MNESTPPKFTIPYKEIIVFYVLACGISWPFFAWRDLFSESWKAFGFEYKNMLYMWGPALSALICFGIFRKSHQRFILFFGTSIIKSLLFYLLPFLVWTITIYFLPGERDLSFPKLMMLTFTGFLMILGEELGWRGFLQDSLRNIKEPKRWLILGLMWEIWHFTRGLVEGSPAQIVIRKIMLTFFVLIITYVIGKLTDRTRSLMVAITFHAWFNIVFEFPSLNTYIAMAVNIVLWFVMLRKWKTDAVSL